MSSPLLVRVRRAAPAIDAALAVAVAVAVFVLLWPFLNPELEAIRGKVTYSWDEGVVLHHALRIAQGEMLYRDFFDFQGFFSYLPFALGFSVATPSPRTGKIVMFLLMAGWGAVTFLTVKEVTHRRWLGVLVALYFPLCVWPTWPFAYQHFIADLWATTAVLFAARGEKRRSPRAWMLAGVFSALAMWTSLSEGLSAFAALLTCVVVVRFARREGWAYLEKFLAGAFGFTAVYVLFLAARGALRKAHYAVLVFPFKHYGPGNRTQYAYDAAEFLGRWRGRGPLEREASELLVEMTMDLPKAGVVAASVVALVLVHRALYRLFTRRPKEGLVPWDTLAPSAYLASLGSLALPVWAGVTRSDIAHIGFVQQMSVLGIAALFLPAETLARRRWTGKWRALTAIQLAAGVALAFVLWKAGAFLRKNASRARWSDIDAYIANDPAHPDRHCETLQARLRPDDRFVALSHGGYTHLTCGRRSGISIPHLLHNDPNYWGAMWPKAARDIVTNRPRLLLVSTTDFEVLARHEPAIRALYMGYSLNYVLREGRPAPPLASTEWWYSIDGPGGALVREGPIRFVPGPGGPMDSPVVAFVDASEKAAFTYVDGPTVQIFDGTKSYVLERRDDGTTMVGKAFDAVAPGLRMTLVKRVK